MPTAVAVDGRTRRRERNAELLYDTALDLLRNRAFDDLSVDEICERAGVGRATFFRIFDTKAGLLREFNRRLAADAAARIAATEPRDLLAALDHVRAAIIDAWRNAGPGLAAMARDFTASSPAADLHSPHPELLALVRDLVATAIETGELAETVPADLSASLAVVHLTAAVAYVLAGHDVDMGPLSKTLLDQWYAGSAQRSITSSS